MGPFIPAANTANSLNTMAAGSGPADFNGAVGILERVSTPDGLAKAFEANRFSKRDAAGWGGAVGAIGGVSIGVLAQACIVSAAGLAAIPLSVAVGVAVGVVAAKSMWNEAEADKKAAAITTQQIAAATRTACFGGEPKIEPAALDSWRARRDLVCPLAGEQRGPAAGKPG